MADHVPELPQLANVAVEGHISIFDGRPFCIVTATNDAGDNWLGQLEPAEARRMAIDWLRECDAAESEAAIWAVFNETVLPADPDAVEKGRQLALGVIAKIRERRYHQ